MKRKKMESFENFNSQYNTMEMQLRFHFGKGNKRFN